MQASQATQDPRGPLRGGPLRHIPIEEEASSGNFVQILEQENETGSFPRRRIDPGNPDWNVLCHVATEKGLQLPESERIREQTSRELFARNLHVRRSREISIS